MKHHLLFAMLLLCGMLCFTACAEPPLECFECPVYESGTILLKTQYPVYAPDTEIIRYTIENASDKDAEFGAEWSLEYKDGDTWKTLPLKFDAWNAIAYLVMPGGEASYSIDLSQIDAHLQDGTYRIVKEINNAPYAAEFEIGDSVYSREAPHGYPPLATLPADYSVEDAIRDGVYTVGGDKTRALAFFDALKLRMGTQLRIGVTEEDGSFSVHDILFEENVGYPRYTYSLWQNGEVTSVYYGYLGAYAEDKTGNYWGGGKVHLTNNPKITAVYDKKSQVSVPMLDLLDGEYTTRILESMTDYEDFPTPLTDVSAIFWSPDGTKTVTLSASDPLSFGVSVNYPDGGSAGSTATLPMKHEKDSILFTKILYVNWVDADTVLFLCETESEMCGYVYYDTEKYEITSYTFSYYFPHINEDGTIEIAE